MPQLHKYKKGHLHKVYSGLWELQLSFCRHEVSNLGLLMFNDLLTEEKESKQCTCKNMTWCFVFRGSFNDWYRVKWSAWTLYDLQEWQKCHTPLLASEACIFAMLLPLFSSQYILIRFTRSIWTLWHLKPHPLSCQDVFHKEALSGSRHLQVEPRKPHLRAVWTVALSEVSHTNANATAANKYTFYEYEV